MPTTPTLLVSILSVSVTFDTTEPGSSFDFHGFISQGFIKSTHNNYLARSERGSFEFTEAAVNMRFQPSPTISMGLQLFLRDLGPLGNYDAKFDWFYVDWSPDDRVSLRAGRVRMPFGLYNDSSDYDPARVTVLLPQSLYPTTAREFLLSVTGGELYGVFDVGPGGLFEYRAYGGTLFLNDDFIPAGSEVEVPYVAGGRFIWETPVTGLKIGGSVMTVRLDFDTMVETISLRIKLPVILWAASAEFVFGDLKLAAEYGRWHTTIESSNEELVPSDKATSERYYVASSYVVTDWAQLGLYYSGLFKDVNVRRGRDNYQHDVAATLRFDFSSFWLVKLEGHLMYGTAVLDSELNIAPPENLTPVWGLFLIKTTAYF